MKSDVESLRGETTWLEMTWLEKTWLEKTWLIGHTFAKRAAVGNLKARLVWAPIVVFAGLVGWAVLPGRSDAETKPEAAPAPAMLSTQNTSWFNPAITPTQATLGTPAEAPTNTAPSEMAPVETSPLDGLKISSQSWRRGGLGSNALVTFTLRNGNSYAVTDIGISCTFTRRDGSHLTDRSRTIHDTVNTRSRRTFARVHIGFVNVNADKAKCSLVAASRI